MFATRLVLLLLASIPLAACDEPGDASAVPDRSPPPGSFMHGAFEGKVPCSDCERVKVRLTLHRSESDNSPTTYVLERILVGQGNDRHVTQGPWTELTGAPVDPEAAVVVLDEQTPEEFRRFLSVGDNLLLLLDAQLEPRVGNEQHSFTLSRTE